MNFSCCADPKPRISDLDGRFFCASCKTWLSVDIDEGEGTAPSETEADDLGDQAKENL